MDNTTWADALHFSRNRRRNHALSAVASAQQRDMVNAIKKWNDASHCIRILESGKRRLQLRSLHRKPENVNGRNLRGNGNIDREVSERTVKPKLFGMFGNVLWPHHQGDRSSSMRQASADQAANTAGPKNRMPHWFGAVVGHGILDSREVKFASRS